MKTRRAPSRRCWYARVDGHTTTGRHDTITPPPPTHTHARAYGLETTRSFDGSDLFSGVGSELGGRTRPVP